MRHYVCTVKLEVTFSQAPRNTVVSLIPKGDQGLILQQHLNPSRSQHHSCVQNIDCAADTTHGGSNRTPRAPSRPGNYPRVAAGAQTAPSQESCSKVLLGCHHKRGQRPAPPLPGNMQHLVPASLPLLTHSWCN